MYRFFVDASDITDGEIRITGSDVNHIKNVLRMKQGEQITISDREDNDYICSIETMTAEEVVAKVLFKEAQGRELSAGLYLFQGLPKSDKMELIIQKAVELGACGIIPVEMKRCVMKLDARKADAKIARWNAIAEAAAKQSKRGVIPKVYPKATMAESIRMAREELGIDVLLMPYELAEGMKDTKAAFDLVKPGTKVGIFIGPEGGLAEEEVALAMEAGAKVLSLGRRILRTETAGMTILSALMIQLELEEEELSNNHGSVS